MDEELSRLERAVETNPESLEAIEELVRYCERVGWAHNGDSIAERLKVLDEFEQDYPFAGPADPTLLRPYGVKVIPGLLAKVSDTEPGRRWAALAYLGGLGAVAKVAVGRLIECLGDDEDPFVWRQVRWALAAIGAETELREALDEVEDEHAARIRDTLAFMGAQPPSEVVVETPETLAGSLAWAFGTGLETDFALFDWKLWSYQADLLRALGDTEEDPWRPNDVLYGGRGIVIEHEGYEQDHQYHIVSDDGGPLKLGEFFFKLHNAAQQECDMNRCDHRFFEGLSYNAGQNHESGDPVYFLCLGS